MLKLIVFNHVSLDGYCVGEGGNFSWARRGDSDPEYSAFVAENAIGGGELLFGRVTYEMMASYWPTDLAAQQAPAVAAGMNRMSKVVFSKSLDQVSWSNTRLVQGDLVAEVRRMKEQPGPGMCILGSGSIVAQLASENLIDEYQMMFDPVTLGKGGRCSKGFGSSFVLL